MLAIHALPTPTKTVHIRMSCETCRDTSPRQCKQSVLCCRRMRMCGLQCMAFSQASGTS